MNQPAYFEIQATDPKTLVEFYRKVFNWQFELQPDLPIEYYQIETEGIRGGLLKRPVETHQGGTNAYTVSMEVEDFDKTAQIILDNGGIVAMDKFAVPGKCWQGYFQDPDQNTFGLFQVDTNAK